MNKQDDTMKLYYSIRVRDKDGNIINSINSPSHCFVRQWYDLMYAHHLNVVTNITDTTGAIHGARGHSNNWRAYAGVGVTDYGIRCGKGTTPVSNLDYALESPIEEGVGLNQLNHLATAVVYPVIAGDTCSCQLQRSMTNNSPAPITDITEIGCYVRMWVGWYVLGFRDVVRLALRPIDIPVGGTIDIHYTLSVTV